MGKRWKSGGRMAMKLPISISATINTNLQAISFAITFINVIILQRTA